MIYRVCGFHLFQTKQKSVPYLNPALVIYMGFFNIIVKLEHDTIHGKKTEYYYGKSEYLHLAYRELKFVPSNIISFTNLTDLLLACNYLTKISPEIGMLTNLTRLSLSNNMIKELPPEFGALINLITLDLAHNQLSSFNFTTFKKLQSLDLNHNKLKSSKIYLLDKLILLNLSHNLLKSLPHSNKLINLSNLDLADNQLTYINLPINLEALWLSKNKFKIMPDVTKLIKLSYLSLSHNQIKIISLNIINLIYLDLI